MYHDDQEPFSRTRADLSRDGLTFLAVFLLLYLAVFAPLAPA